jgi:hypothetical protein
MHHTCPTPDTPLFGFLGKLKRKLGFPNLTLSTGAVMQYCMERSEYLFSVLI